jgi:hypothetical protein
MKVLFITNSATQKCGVRVYGELWMDALRTAGVEIDEWDGTYPSIMARGGEYLPETVDEYDLVHLNWDPQAINHYIPEHFASVFDRQLPPLSIFLHDVPPNSTCPVAPCADLLLAHEPGEGIVVIDHAVPDYRPTNTVPYETFTVGTSGIRNDPGVELVQQVCDRNGWWHSRSGEGRGWRTTEGEIARLAQCHVNVCWYATSGRGKSMAAMLMVAAQRPLVLSNSTMFSALTQHPDYDVVREITLGYSTHDSNNQPTKAYANLDYLADCIALAHQGGVVPTAAATELRWSRCAEQIKALWEEHARG